MAKPTVAQPWVVNSDGTVSVLVMQGRNFRARITHPSLAVPGGYKARIAFRATYDSPILAQGTTDDGSITLHPTGTGGTFVVVNLQDEVTESIDVTKGRWDLVLQNPAGEEDALLVGDFVVQPPVTP